MDGHIAKISKLFIINSLLFVALIFLLPKNTISNAYAATDCASIVMNADTLDILKGEHYHIRLPMASTTKIMTALLICENCLPNEKIKIPKEAVGIEGSSLYLKEGETLTIKDLLYGLMLRSGNDCAVALALHLGENINNFAEMMNLRAQSLGLNDTHYVNPHGLHDKDHYTSAYDLCKLGCIAMRNPLFKEIVSTKITTIGVEDNKRTITNKNKILTQYEGGNGIKTGFTRAAGRCLVSAAERNNVQLVAAVLNIPDMFGVCSDLMDYGFSVIKNKSLK